MVNKYAPPADDVGALHPGERLLERLQMGFSVPDPELFYRAHSFTDWADENPLGALTWLPKLRRTGQLDCTAPLWAAVADIVEGRDKPAPQPAPAPRIFTPVVVDKVVCVAPVKKLDTVFSQAESLIISQRYLAWEKSVVTDVALREVSKFAPNRVTEVLALEARSDDTQDPAVRLAILRKAASIWASLLNIKEPVL